VEATRPALEHGLSRGGRWLRVRRLQLALWIAVAEAVLILFGVVPRWPALAVAALLIVFYLLAGRQLRSDIARQASWVAATSQVLVALIPALVFLVGALALVAIVVLAGLALIVLVADRR
jgi:hypothetical protein